MKLSLLVIAVGAFFFLAGATLSDFGKQREKEQAETVSMVKRLICSELLEPGERVSMTVERYRDRVEVSASYRDANGKTRHSAPILPGRGGF